MHLFPIPCFCLFGLPLLDFSQSIGKEICTKENQWVLNETGCSCGIYLRFTFLKYISSNLKIFTETALRSQDRWRSCWMNETLKHKLLFSRIHFFGLGTHTKKILSAFLSSLYFHFSFISLQLLKHSRNCIDVKKQILLWCMHSLNRWEEEHSRSIYFSLFPTVIAVSSVLVQNAPGWILKCIILSFISGPYLSDSHSN